MDYIFSRRGHTGQLYAYADNRFWFWNYTRAGIQKWTPSAFARQQYEKVALVRPGLTPADFLTASAMFTAEQPENVTAEQIDLLTDAIAGKKEDAENPTSAAPASPADAGAATQSLSAAEPASLAAEAPTAFDYSGLDLPTRDTLRWAEKEIGGARRDYIARIAQAVSIAHDALCPAVVQNLDNSKHGNRGEEAFTSWCASVGIKRSTAYNLLQVQALLSGATPEEQATLEAAGPSLLYAAAKPSAPAELVQAVKDGDITTHKQYQEALAEIRARDAKIEELLDASEAADRRADEAEARAKHAEDDAARVKRDKADLAADCNRLGAQSDKAAARARAAEQERDEALRRAEAAEREAAELKRQAAQVSPVIEAQAVDADEVEARAQELAEKMSKVAGVVGQIKATANSVVAGIEAVDDYLPCMSDEVADAVVAAYQSIAEALETMYHHVCEFMGDEEAEIDD